MDALGPQLQGVEFAMFTPDEIRNLAVVEVVTPLSLNALGHPLPGGLYDLRMGPTGSQSGPCETCQAMERNCPGHFGYISLPLPVVNPLYHRGLYTILRMACTTCHRVQLPGRAKALLTAQLQVLELGLVKEAVGLEEIVQEIREDGAPDEVTSVLIKDELATHVIKYKSKSRDDADVSDTTMLEALRSQFLNEALKQQAKSKACIYCKAPIRSITTYQNRLISGVSKVEVADKFKDGPSTSGTTKRSTAFLLPSDSMKMLRSLWRNEQELMVTLFPVLTKASNMTNPTDLMYMDVLLVPPPKVRPLNFVQRKILEHEQTKVYKNILNNCIIMRNIRRMMEDGESSLSAEGQAVVETVRGDTPLDKMNTAWSQLQGEVDHLLDTEMSKTTRKAYGEGLKQVIEKKEGVIRMHMMGKRVNFAARSVITPDPNLNIEEIGVPEVFAMKLTYPEYYNGKNFEELRCLIENGPDVYPGANYVETGTGKMIKLAGGEENRKKRVGVAKRLQHSGDDTDTAQHSGKIVHRHLLNGDMLLLNRQPTLHRPSIMAHEARVLKSEKTLRMHYSNCKSYNADFDGDEMNAHCPQNEVARAEALTLVSVPHQYLVPKDGTPLGGLIQDHVIAGVHLTVRGLLLSKQDYQQLVYQALADCRGDIILLPPCMLKPRRLWSGKQVISTILLNIIPKKSKPISMVSHSKTSLKSWEKMTPRPWRAGGKKFADPRTMSEAEVVVQQGRLVCGVLDKQHFGATQYSLTHCLFELYGGQVSCKFLNALGRLFTFYLQLIGFTIGVEDILVKPGPDVERRNIIEEARGVGDVAAARALELDTPPPDLRERLEAAYFQDRAAFRVRLDGEYKKALDEFTNAINKTCLPGGLIAQFPQNNLQLMVVAGAKGSTVNTMQISCLLGQIELEGKRPPLMLSGRSLPSFRPFETAPRAGGFIDGRFMTGILPQDFFFHCMAGREGLIDTAVKTSRSGYLQRCLIKHLEGLSVAYDHTVRNHDGTVVQFAYGEDGMEVSKAVFFKPSQIDFLFNNRYAILHKQTLAVLRDPDTGACIAQQKEAIAAWRRSQGRDRPRAAFTNFSASICDEIEAKYRTSINPATGRPKAYRKVLKKWSKMDEEGRTEMRIDRCPDPVTATFHAHRDFGAISEKLDMLVADYLRSRPLITPRRTTNLHNLMALKSMTGLCAPGEPVGLLAAQSVGEPSTQMTLNTFHFAGRGEMNVTLGIPRLREILMTASKSIKTPSMDIPLFPSPKAQKHAERLRRTLQRVTIADVLENVTVLERLETSPTRVFTYTVRFNFLPHRCYRKEFSVTPSVILKHMEKNFLADLSKAIRLLGKRYGELIHESQEEKRVKADEEKDADDLDNQDDVLEPDAQVGGAGGKAEKEDESSDEEPDGDGDASTERRRARHQEAREYDENTDASDAASDTEGEGQDEAEPDAHEGEKSGEVSEALTKQAEMRISQVQKTFGIVRTYRFDQEHEEWCELVIGVPVTLSKIDFASLLRDVCGVSVVYEIPGIRRAIVYKTQRGEVAIKTEGINITAMSRHSRILNLQRLYCNDIHMMAATYGVEASGRVLVKELQAVFQVYGITVDPRHLILISDYMTMQGVFLPMSRTGMTHGSSALQQMSFESAVSFLRRAVFRGRRDELASPSARVMVGRPCVTGTGSFGLRPAPIQF